MPERNKQGSRPFSGIGTRLKTAMAAAGVSNEVLAAAVGVHVKTVSAWRSGLQEPTLENLETIAPMLGVSRDYLKSGAEPSLKFSGGGTATVTAAASMVGVAEVEAHPTFSQQARAFINRFMAELADAGVTADEESWARRLLTNPDNIGYNVGGHTPTLDEDAMLRDLEGMSIGVRMLLRARGYKNLKPR